MPGSVYPHNRDFSIFQTAISSNGTYLTINRAIPIGVTSGVGFDGQTTLDDVAYEIVTGAGVTGTVQFQFLGFDGVWRNGPTASTTITLAASTPYMSNLAMSGLCPCVGVQIVVSSLAGGNIAYAHITGKVS